MERLDVFSRLRKAVGAFGCVVALFGSGLSSVFAAEIHPLAPALGYNIFQSGDFTNQSGHARGPAAIGGNFYFGASKIAESFTGPYIAPGDTLRSVLVVGGSNNFAR